MAPDEKSRPARSAREGSERKRKKWFLREALGTPQCSEAKPLKMKCKKMGPAQGARYKLIESKRSCSAVKPLATIRAGAGHARP